MKAVNIELVRALLTVLVALLAVGACQTIPPGWRVSLRAATSAAVDCIDAAEGDGTKAVKIARCAEAIVDEAADAVEELDDPAPPSKPVDRGIRPTPPKLNRDAEPSDVPDASPRDASPTSTAWRAPFRSRPPATGWPYRYRR